jgi:hypothetical protein
MNALPYSLKSKPSQDSITLPKASRDKVDPSESRYFWYPQRLGVKLGPAEFRKRLHEIHDGLEVTWHPIMERWQVWYKMPRVRYHLCPGWFLLFNVETSDGEFIPLDERTLAAVYEQSGKKWGNGLNYWNRIESEHQRQAERAQRDRDDKSDERASEYWDYMKIKNIGHGSKFANHHSE